MKSIFKRALDLLQRILTPEEFEHWQQTESITIRHDQKTYYFGKNSYVRMGRGLYCVELLGGIYPSIDAVILKYLLLKRDPAHFHKIAQVY